MDTQANTGDGLRGRALRLLSEQGAIPLDQLRMLLGVSAAAAKALVATLQGDGCVECRQFLVGDERWAWLTEAGAAEAGLGFPAGAPAARGLAHRRALNGVRFYLEAREPGGEWICERGLLRDRVVGGLIPDALFAVQEAAGGGREVHAIEVELSRKRVSERRERLTDFSERFDLVVYFCGPQAYPSMERMRLDGRWPKLIVRKLPRRSL